MYTQQLVRKLADAELEFLQAMIAAGEFRDPERVLDFLEKPYKWQDEYDCWLANGKPLDASEVGWEEFLLGIEP